MQEQVFRFDEKKHIYYWQEKRMHGVTSVLGVIAKPMLINWAAKMTAEWIRENCRELPDYPIYQVSEPDLQEAVKAHTKRKEKAADAGTKTHQEIEKFVKYCIEHDDGQAVGFLEKDDDQLFGELEPDIRKGVDSFRMWAQENKIKFLASEKKVYSLDWFTAGTADIVMEKDGKTYIGDIKTHKKLWDNVPFIQCAAYAKMLKECEGIEATGTCIITIPKETQKVEAVFREHIGNDIQSFEAALHLYKSVPLN